MSISLPTGDSKIDLLLVELTDLVKIHGSKSFPVETFIENNKDEIWTDKYTGITHYFSEIAETMAELMGGITNPDSEGDEEEEQDTADWWKQPVDD
jgi:hypothetical protein